MATISPGSPFGKSDPTLVDYWWIFARRRAIILRFVVVITVATAIISFLLPNIYQGKTTLLPLSKGGGSLATALGELSGLLPAGLGAGAKDSSAEPILAILSSRTLAEDVIQRLDLMPHLFEKQWDAEKRQWLTESNPTLQDGVRALAEHVTIFTDSKTSVINITIEDPDPQLAAAIANEYVATLQRILNKNAFSLAKKNRLFIEAQIQKTRQDLGLAEEALREFEQTHNIIALEAQASAAVSALAALESQIMAKEVQLGVLQRSVTGASHESTLLQEELQGLRVQLSRLQRVSQVSLPTDTNGMQLMRAFPVVEEAPEIKLQYSRLQREALVQNKLFTLLMQQLEQARITEAQDETSFQLIDEAVIPNRKIKPRRLLNVVLATVIGTFMGLFVAFFWEAFDSTLHTREHVEHRISLPLLAVIPASTPHRWWRRSALPADTSLVFPALAGTTATESYRFLQARLKRYNDSHGIRAMLFVSAELQDAAPATIAHLGIVAASMGWKTLLLDANLRQPGLHRLLQCSVAPGLVESLSDPSGWQKSIQSTHIDNLHLLPAGVGFSGMLTSAEVSTFESILRSCQETYELTLCTAPPVLGYAETLMLSTRIEATCLVLTCHVSRSDAVEEAKSALEAVGANVVGTLLTNVRG